MAKRRPPLHPVQFSDLKLEYEDKGGMGSLEAHHPVHGLIGHVYWNTDPKYKSEPVGGVTNITVGQSFQNQGVGAHLFTEAKRRDSRVQHSKNLTTEGRKFVAAMNRRAEFEGGMGV